MSQAMPASIAKTMRAKAKLVKFIGGWILHCWRFGFKRELSAFVWQNVDPLKTGGENIRNFAKVCDP